MKNPNPIPTATRKTTMYNMLPVGAFGLSLLIHVGALLLVGGAVLIHGVIPKDSFEDFGSTLAMEDTLVLPEAPPDEVADRPVLEQISDAPQSVAQAADSADVAADMIIAGSPNGSMNLLPAMAGPVVPLANNLGIRESRPAGPSGKKLIKLFGNPLESSSLGVILDVSGSTHTLLLPVMEEIESKYGHARTVLVFGCGMGALGPEKMAGITVQPFKERTADPVRDKAGSRTTLGQIALAMGKSNQLQSYIKKLKTREDVWIVEGGDLQATRKAFEKLMEEKVDTIFWFADFQDQVTVVEAEDLAKKLKSNAIRVVMFDFTGKMKNPAAASLAEKTGGKVISQLLK